MRKINVAVKYQSGGIFDFQFKHSGKGIDHYISSLWDVRPEEGNKNDQPRLQRIQHALYFFSQSLTMKNMSL